MLFHVPTTRQNLPNNIPLLSPKVGNAVFVKTLGTPWRSHTLVLLTRTLSWARVTPHGFDQV